jgi:hypothetical protein
MTVTEVKSKKVRLEQAIRTLIEEFENETITTVKTIYTNSRKKGQMDRVEAEIVIETFYTEPVKVAA